MHRSLVTGTESVLELELNLGLQKETGTSLWLLKNLYINLKSRMITIDISCSLSKCTYNIQPEQCDT